MRNLFPQNNSTDILAKDSDIVKKEDLLPITEQLQNTIQQLNILSDSLSQYETDNTQAINTTQLNAINAAISTINATLANLESAEVDNLTVNSLAQLTNLTTQIATITTSLTVPDATIHDLLANDIQAGTATITDLEVATISADSWNAENFSTSDLSVSNKIEAKDIESDTATISSLSAGNIATDNKVEASVIESDSADIDDITSEEVRIENITWNGSISLTNDETLYLEEIRLFSFNEE